MLRKKTFRTYEEQIDFLRNRGIAIEDEKEAIEALSTYSYYSLVNLNKHLYGGLTERQFIGNPSLLDLQLAHMLNMNFYQVILKGILYIEASFKTKLAYLISREYGVMSRENIDDPNDNFLYRGYYEDAHPVSTNTLRSLAGEFQLRLQLGQEAHHQDGIMHEQDDAEQTGVGIVRTDARIVFALRQCTLGEQHEQFVIRK
jgi:abortive infection bacteriophage resistance protein